jgi:ribose transport system ATP-binding protein
VQSRILEVDGLARAFGSTLALVDFTLHAEAGTIHAILGQNGSGKSTVVKILSGILTPDRGRVSIGGSRITKFSPSVAHAAGVATVFQELLNVPSRSVLDNVMLGMFDGLRYRSTRREQAQTASELLSQLGAPNLDLEGQVKDLPLSVQQLVAIARALARHPRVLILDEASSTLDVETRVQLFGTLRAEVARGVLVVLITHRIEEIVHLADAVTVLRNGTVVANLTGAQIAFEKLLDAMAPAAPADLVALA